MILFSLLLTVKQMFLASSRFSWFLSLTSFPTIQSCSRRAWLYRCQWWTGEYHPIILDLTSWLQQWDNWLWLCNHQAELWAIILQQSDASLSTRLQHKLWCSLCCSQWLGNYKLRRNSAKCVAWGWSNNQVGIWNE